MDRRWPSRTCRSQRQGSVCQKWNIVHRATRKTIQRHAIAIDEYQAVCEVGKAAGNDQLLAWQTREDVISESDRYGCALAGEGREENRQNGSHELVSNHGSVILEDELNVPPR